MSNQSNQPSDEAKKEYGVLVPCSQDDFGQFISGLLGKPQVLEKIFYGNFDVGRNDVLNTFHLVDQRVRQQNQATLVQFSVKIIYDDDSSVLLSSLGEFEHFTEIRPLVSTAVHLSWTYLILFRDKHIPEKQQIDLSIVTKSKGSIVSKSEEGIIVAHRRLKFTNNYISFRVGHTARTWGVDIESLLTGHIKSLLKPENKVKSFVNQKSSLVGLLFGLIFILIILAGTFITANQIVKSHLAILEKVSNLELLSKIDYLLEYSASGIWTRFALAATFFIFFMLIISMFFAAWIADKAEKESPSFLILSRKAADIRDAALRKVNRDWFLFIISIVVSFICGMLSNVAFYYLSRKFFGEG